MTAFLKKFLTGLVLYRCLLIYKKLDDAERYQTVYSRYKALPRLPPGLHFTLELLEELAGRGVKIAYVTLHVGLGTFRPVKVEIWKSTRCTANFTG